MNCDTCGIKVSTTGFLGGGIVCKDCARDKSQGNTEALQERIDKHGGGEDYNGDVTELLY